jgi:hypothetical protein
MVVDNPQDGPAKAIFWRDERVRGVMGVNVALTLGQITDGTSNTMLVGEAVHNASESERLAHTRESYSGDRKDHWAIGGDSVDIRGGVDLSECLGSTGVPINLHRSAGVVPCLDLTKEECQALQLSFSSEHPGIMQGVLCDGSVRQINEGIDPVVWSSLGSRADGLPVDLE